MQPTSVYIIASGDHLKIGVARDPAKRMKTLKTGMPHGASLVASREFRSAKSAYNVESRLHRYFHRYRANGEWFAAPLATVKARLRAIPELDEADLAQTSRTVWNEITEKEARDEIRAAFERGRAEA
jgi:predicted GIY-YIG superfamily endonuclease